MRVILWMIVGISCLLHGSESVIRGNLQWQDNADAKTVEKDWAGAKSYCANLTLDGYSNWRLPTIKELQSIVDRHRTPTIKTGFKNIPTDVYSWYWSASPYVYLNSFVWVVDFNNGSTNNGSKKNTFYVRCVRSRQ